MDQSLVEQVPYFCQFWNEQSARFMAQSSRLHIVPGLSPSSSSWEDREGEEQEEDKWTLGEKEGGDEEKKGNEEEELEGEEEEMKEEEEMGKEKLEEEEVTEEKEEKLTWAGTEPGSQESLKWQWQQQLKVMVKEEQEQDQKEAISR